MDLKEYDGCTIRWSLAVSLVALYGLTLQNKIALSFDLRFYYDTALNSIGTD